MVFAMATDLVILIAMTLSGFLGGSLTMVAESVRAWLAHALDWFTLVLLRRVHRGQIADVDFGAGKVEQIANVAIATGMLLGSGWIALRVLRGRRDRRGNGRAHSRRRARSSWNTPTPGKST